MWLFQNGMKMPDIARTCNVSVATLFSWGLAAEDRKDRAREEMTPAPKHWGAKQKHRRIYYWSSRGALRLDIADVYDYSQAYVARRFRHREVYERHAHRLAAVARRKFALGDDDAPLPKD